MKLLIVKGTNHYKFFFKIRKVLKYWPVEQNKALNEFFMQMWHVLFAGCIFYKYMRLIWGGEKTFILGYIYMYISFAIFINKEYSILVIEHKCLIQNQGLLVTISFSTKRLLLVQWSHRQEIGLVWFYGISTIVKFLMPYPVYIYIYIYIYIYMICKYFVGGIFKWFQV